MRPPERSGGGSPADEPARGRTRIKICGITTVEHALASVDAGADAIGLVFAPGSPRQIDMLTADAILAALPPMVTPVGLFQNPGVEEVRGQWREQWVQLHGEEDESLMAHVGGRIIKGFRFAAEDVRRWDRCPYVSALLIDGSTGGRGEAFNHEALAAMMDELEKPVILAGGLKPGNVAEAIRTVRPFAVDVSSGVERQRGIKDIDLIREFCHAAREALA